MGDKNRSGGVIFGDFCRIHVRVHCPALLGQKVGVLGLSPQGEDVHVELVTSPDAYPIWHTAEAVVVPKNSTLCYRYCLLEAGAVKVFEHDDSARIIIARDEDVVLEDEFDLRALLKEIEDHDQNSKATTAANTPRPPRGSRHGGHSINSNDHANSSGGLTPRSADDEEAWTKLIDKNTRLFIVCYHLPVSIKRTPPGSAQPFEATWNESLIARSENSVAGSMPTTWIGTVNLPTKDLTEEDKASILDLLRKMDCICVFLDDELTQAAYFGCCKGVMWPVFHNVDQLDQIHAAWNLNVSTETTGNTINSSLFPTAVASHSRTRGSFTTDTASPNDISEIGVTNGPSENKVLEWNKKEEEYNKAFNKVNEMFANTLCKLLQNNDTVWVHDYHLMPLPKLIRAQSIAADLDPKTLKIIFFLHIPFPTSQIFRTLPEASELLQSMLSADLVGFHAFDHARHFLNAVKRMHGIRCQTRRGGMLTLNVQDREVIITMSHVSIETNRVDKVVNDPVTQEMAKAIKEKFRGRKIVLGIDVCQRLSGLALKMAGFEKLLADYNAIEKGGIVLIQRCIKQGSRIADEETTSSDMKKFVADLNSKYSDKCGTVVTSFGVEEGQVVDYLEIPNHKGLSLQERVALYLASDVFLLTPIREGLNLMPLEYVYARKDLPRAGALVVSEFSTCSSLLNGSLKVNPFSPSNVADAVEKGLGMSSKECEYRRKRDLPFISSHPSSLWTKQILSELRQLQQNTGISRIDLSKLAMPLSVATVKTAYQHAGDAVGIMSTGSRVFVFDYGGGLLHKEKFDIYMKQTMSAISGRRPTKEMMDAVKKLSEDPQNIVVIITGLTKLKLNDVFHG